MAKLEVPCCMIQISDEEERFKKRSWQSVYITEYSDGNMHIHSYRLLKLTIAWAADSYKLSSHVSKICNKNWVWHSSNM